MRKRKKLKRVISGFLAVFICVTLNIEPVSIIAGALCETEFVKDCGVLYNNLKFLASNGFKITYAAESSSESGCNCTFSCSAPSASDIASAISDIAGSDYDLRGIYSRLASIDGDTDWLDDIYGQLGNINNNLTAIDGGIDAINTNLTTINTSLGDINDTLGVINTELNGMHQDMNMYLSAIETELGMISGELDGMTHDYRVAHLYSLNNEERAALWRPAYEDVKGVVDFAYLNGGFANIYAGGWDTLKSPIDKSHELLSGVGATRALEVLGYDAILRREGFVVIGERAYCDRHPQRVYFAFNDLTDMYDSDCAERLDSGQLVCPICYRAIVESGNLESLNGLASSSTWESLIHYVQIPIPEEDITWFDAVSVLYKALGQETITYRSFMYHNNKITPATSPAYQNLSNIDGFDSYDYQYDTVKSYVYDYEYDSNGNKKDKNGDGLVDQKDLMPADVNKDGKIDDADKVIETQVIKDSNGDGIITSADKTVVKKKVFQGYDYKIFVSRSNILTNVQKIGDTEEDATKNAEAFDVYWTRALNDGFVLDANKDKPITGQDFYKLCQRMMETYGEPVLNQDEIDALLQVYGAEYPIQLGTEVADAWAYLKARGCLETDISYTGTVSRDQLLDVAMRIKDKDSRTDYKNINIVLDLADVMISDGYYPVADLNIAKGDFSATTTYDYGNSDYYDILIPDFHMTATYTNNSGQTVNEPINNFAVLTKETVNGAQFNYTEFVAKNDSDKRNYLNSFGVFQGSYQGTNEIGGYTYHHFWVPRPKDTNGSGKLVPQTIWIVPISTFPEAKPGTPITVDRKFVKVPAKYNIGGIFDNCPDSQTYFEIKSNPTFFNETNYASTLLSYTDCERAGDLEFIKEGVKGLAYLPEEPTLLESLIYCWDTLTTPMVVEAANPVVDNPNDGATTSIVTIGFNNFDNTTTDVNIAYESAETEAYIGTNAFKYLKMAEQPDSATALLNRMVTAFEYTNLKEQLSDAATHATEDYHAGYLFDSLEVCLTDGRESSSDVYPHTYGLTPKDTYGTFNPRGAGYSDNGFTPTPIGNISAVYLANCNEWNTYKENNTTISYYGIQSPKVSLKYNYTISQWPAKFVLGLDGMSRFDIQGALYDEYDKYVNAVADANYHGQVGVVDTNRTNSFYNIFFSTLYVDEELVTDKTLTWIAGAPQTMTGLSNEAAANITMHSASYSDSKIFWHKALGKSIDTSSIPNYSNRINSLGNLLTDIDLRYKAAKEDWDTIWDMCVEYEIQNVTQEPDGTIKVELKGDANSFVAAIGEELSQTSGYTDKFMDKTVSTLLDTSIKTSAIMSRKENVLISWDDLIAAKFVIDTFDGRNPEKDATGTYNIQTVYGLVKVNPEAHTILIGNTFYNLDDNGTGPNLVYIHLDEDTNEDTFYLDYRCIMGLCSDNLRQDKEMTTAIKAEDSLGVGNSVVYNICAGEVDTKLFKTKEFNTNLYPDVDKFSNTTTGLRSYYRTNLLLGTMYDGETIVNNNIANGASGREFMYWDKTIVGNRKRMTMSTFNPTANWLVTVRQTDASTNAYLYVWYPRNPFMNGFDDFGNADDGTDQITTVTMPSEVDFKSLADSAVNKCFIYDGKSFEGIWNSVYGDTTLEWFDYMTKYSAACLFNETNGGYYLDKDYVCRRFDISDSTAVSPVNEFRTDEFTSNDSGAMYWLEGIGFVYNIPDMSEFTMKRYFEGYYPLPIAMDANGKYGSLSIVNFNLDNYGIFKVDGNEVQSKYGWALSSNGVVDLDGNVKYSKTQLEGYWADKAALDALKSDTEKYPFVIDDSGGYVMAPAGIYSIITGLAEESVTTKGLTGYVTNANHVYYGTKRLQFERSDTGDYYFFLGQGQYNPILVPANMEFRRVYHNTYDVLVAFPDGLEVGSGGRVANVDISNEYANPLKNFLDGWGATSLLETIDEGASFAILIALQVIPIAGIAAMTILIGLAFLGQAQFFRNFCDAVIDPVRWLTLNKRSIHTWEFRRVILPCVLLYIAFALFLNGNIIRVIVMLAEWYDVIVKWMRTW